jgi:hypothetical protein
MVRPATPYSASLGDRDPLEAIRAAITRVTLLADSWRADSSSKAGSGDVFERTYAPGKWTVREILIHLAQIELAFGNRVRMALSTPGYVAQAFDQDAWLRIERSMGGLQAAETFLVLARMNAELYGALQPADKETPLKHPQFGDLTVDWVVHQSAGHLLHHLKQLEAVGNPKSEA